MNENNFSNVKPYKATGNLNTVIANPSANINDTMNVNIQSMQTNIPPVNNINQKVTPTNTNQTYNTNTDVSNNTTTVVVPNIQTNQTQNNNRTTTQGVSTTENSEYVKKTYVTTDNKPKKKTIKFDFGPEFKTAFLIIVILLVFVLLLPIISDLFRGF